MQVATCAQRTATSRSLGRNEHLRRPGQFRPPSKAAVDLLRCDRLETKTGPAAIALSLGGVAEAF